MFGEMLFGVTALSVLSGMLLRLFPRSGRLMPYIRFLSSLILLVMLLSPLITLLSSLHNSDPTVVLIGEDTLEDYEGFWEQHVTDAACTRMESALAALICAEYGMEMQDLRVELTTAVTHTEDETTATVTAVTVMLYRQEHRIAGGKIAALVEETMLCPCNVVCSEEDYA